MSTEIDWSKIVDLSQIHFLCSGDKVRLAHTYPCNGGSRKGVVTEARWSEETGSGRGAYRVHWENPEWKDSWVGRYGLDLLIPNTDGVRDLNPDVPKADVKFELGCKYELAAINAPWVSYWMGWAGRSHHGYYHVPVEAIITQPGRMVYPVQARYITLLDYSHYGGVVVENKALRHLLGVPRVHWGIVMVELFRDWGNDGHVDHRLTDYGFLKEEPFLKAVREWDGVWGHRDGYNTLNNLLASLEYVETPE